MAKSKKGKTKKKNEVSIILTVVAVLFVVFLVAAIVKKTTGYSRQKEVLSQKQEELSIKEEKNSELASQVENTDEDAVIEQRAREQGYAYPDERLYYDITPGAN